MRLNSLEIKGFKSFGDKVTIHFDKGVTAIVGPNGSGKSNVVDAMRWVLGEQKTRMLRSEKMDNIIFNGTRTRNPANLAEVSLTFENTKNILATEYSTVTITRKLYRDGDSEYYLNNVQCRLKDITDLFLDTGIGPDSYSIIELKMVDELLNDKHNTISQLLEEAAGVSKYKIRKKQTLSKLAETDNDLNRVNDLMFEIEKSLKQLEQQAKKAEKYNRLKGEYKEYSIASALYNIKGYRLQFEELQLQEQQQTDEKIKFATQIDTQEAALQAKKTEALEKEKSLSAAQKILNEKLIAVSQLENTKTTLQNKISLLEEKELKINIQNEEDDKSMVLLQNELTQLVERKTEAEQKLSAMQQELVLQKEKTDELKLQFSKSQEELKFLNEHLFKTRQELNQHETKLAVNQARFGSLNDELLRINEQYQLSMQKLQDVDAELQQVMPQKQELENSIAAQKEKKILLENIQREKSERLKSFNTQLLDASRKADAKLNEYNLTKNMLEQMDGFPESIKFLKTNHEKSKRSPLLSDIISCKDDYKIAIENYLEPYLNYFVADYANDALEALNILSESAKGRANFFILQNFKIKSSDSITPPVDSIPAMSVVEFEEKYRPMFEHLLAHVFIVDDVKRLADFPDNMPRMVLLSSNGTIVRQRYSFAGGSIGLFDGKRTGKYKNLQAMENDIKDLQASVEYLQKEVHEIEIDTNALNADYKELIAQLNVNEISYSKNTATFTSLNNNKNFLNTGLSSFKATIEKLENEIGLLTNAGSFEGGAGDSFSDELRNMLNKLIDDQKQKQEQVNLLQQQSGENSQQYNQHNIACIQQSNLLQNITRDLEFKNSELQNITARKAHNTEELKNTMETLHISKSEFETHTSILIAMLEEKNIMATGLNEFENDYFKSKSEIDESERAINDFRRQKENAETVVQNIHDKINDLKLQLNSLKERLNVEFDTDINNLLEETPDEQLNEEELHAKVEKLKKQIADFGPVNPMALEQFTEIKERHDFILKEQEDLKNAKASLLQTIAEIDTTAHEKFMEAFIKVRENFIVVFRSLFREEDKCDLVLSDPSNPLDSEINIIAQPKGKKPLSIQQLSGGEKTLTATALLFGIYLLKPAPFCIFDEVDAPLDDNNIDKFIHIIQKFSDETQFIIITHNKKTMTATDIIYGVTMAEQGITQLVPVDMREFEEVV